MDMDLWTLNNKYDYRKDIDQFMQVNLRNKKFDKNKRMITIIFSIKKQHQSTRRQNKGIFTKIFLVQSALYYGLLYKRFKNKWNYNL